MGSILAKKGILHIHPYNCYLVGSIRKGPPGKEDNGTSWPSDSTTEDVE